jgi:hypothetical protein
MVSGRRFCDELDRPLWVPVLIVLRKVERLVDGVGDDIELGLKTDTRSSGPRRIPGQHLLVVNRTFHIIASKCNKIWARGDPGFARVFNAASGLHS